MFERVEARIKQEELLTTGVLLSAICGNVDAAKNMFETLLGPYTDDVQRSEQKKKIMETLQNLESGKVQPIKIRAPRRGDTYGDDLFGG